MPFGPWPGKAGGGGTITSITGGAGISVTNPTGPVVTITNAGVQSVSAGAGISIGGTAQNPSVANTGVLAVTGGTGATVSGPQSARVVDNTGVLSVTSGGAGISIGGTAQNPSVANTLPGSDIAQAASNHIINGGLRLFQRQNPATPTTRANTTGRVYGPDRWTLTTQNAAGFAVSQVLTSGAPPAGNVSPYYAVFSPLTAVQKVVLATTLESQLCQNLRGKVVTLQFALRMSTTAANLRIGLLQLTSAGAVNVIPATFVSAFNANATDPTFGTNLALITPTSTSGGTISGSGVTCAATTSFQVFSATFTAPANFLNLIPVVWADSQLAVGNAIHMTDTGLFLASTVQTYQEPDPTLDASRCNRYCVKTFQQTGSASAPVQNAGLGTGELNGLAAKAGAVLLRGQIQARFPVDIYFGAAPVVTFFNPSAANAQARNVNLGADCTGTVVGAIQADMMSIDMTGNSSAQPGDLLALHALVEAEL